MKRSAFIHRRDAENAEKTQSKFRVLLSETLRSLRLGGEYSLPLLAALALCCASAPAQTGFPFTDEALHYSINWPSGLSLGDATLSAHKTKTGWSFDISTDAGVPGFSISDKYHSSATPDLCSIELTRDTSRGTKKTREKTSFDTKKGTARRVTTFPEGGGSTNIDMPSCPRDAIAFLYFVRREMGQGRVAPPENVYFGGTYSVRLEYTGAVTIPVDQKQTVTDHVNVSIKGPKTNIIVEVFFARDAARTPLLVRIPLAVANISLELVR
jgi:hypothetical protein